VHSPFSPAEGTYTVIKRAIAETHHFRFSCSIIRVTWYVINTFPHFSMDSPATVLDIPIEEEHMPGVHLEVNLVPADRSGK